MAVKLLINPEKNTFEQWTGHRVTRPWNHKTEKNTFEQCTGNRSPWNHGIIESFNKNAYLINGIKIVSNENYRNSKIPSMVSLLRRHTI